MTSINIKKQRPFDFSKYPKRRIAIMFLYLGWDFDGMVRQENTLNTVEQTFFNALIQIRLIESAESCDWTRCGRTDKGVSAFRQVAALTVRSTDVSNDDCFWPASSHKSEQCIKSKQELPYIKMLNGVLPKSIRVIAFSSVDRDFSARFDCVERVYTYVFPMAMAINVLEMSNSCQRLIGSHDFRNFCHIDKNSGRLEMSYIRTINNAIIEKLNDNFTSENNSEFTLLKLTISATGFLWHQIRCIVTILYEIGCGNEKPELIDQLLDVEIFPSRPQYKLANELPLCLFDCTFGEGKVNWQFDRSTIFSVIETLQKLWAEHQVKASNIKQMIGGLVGMTNVKMADKVTNIINVKGLDEFIKSGPAQKKYEKMATRPRCMSLLEVRDKINRKRKSENFEASDETEMDESEKS